MQKARQQHGELVSLQSPKNMFRRRKPLVPSLSQTVLRRIFVPLHMPGTEPEIHLDASSAAGP
jgi:hypothetical protein